MYAICNSNSLHFFALYLPIEAGNYYQAVGNLVGVQPGLSALDVGLGCRAPGQRSEVQHMSCC